MHRLRVGQGRSQQNIPPIGVECEGLIGVGVKFDVLLEFPDSAGIVEERGSAEVSAAATFSPPSASVDLAALEPSAMLRLIPETAHKE